tara:strand:- start:1015 stop:1446 length:432 start_codon:yes stop_codon:yes gene_type:complete
MSSSKAISLSGIIILANGLLGHFLAPSGIFLTPFVLLALSVIICPLNKEVNIIVRSALLVAAISFHDILIKLFSGGYHDRQGLGWIHMLLFIGLVPAFIILLIGVFKAKNESTINKVVAVLIFPILIWIHFLAFGELGLGRNF